MALSRNELLTLIKGIKMDDVLIFCTKPQDKQIFILQPSMNFPGKYNVCECGDLETEFKKYFGCSIEVSEKNGDLFVKFFPGYSAGERSSNLPYNWSRNPIDAASIQIKEDQVFEKIIIEETEKQKMKSKCLSEYAKIEKTMKSLIPMEITVKSKNVRYRDDGSGEGYYSYDAKTNTYYQGLSELIMVLSDCIKHYEFNGSDNFFDKYDELLEILKQKNPEKTVRAVELNKIVANRLGYIYVKFLKYLSEDSNIELDEDYKYKKSFSRNGFGSNCDYTVIVTDPIVKIKNGVSSYMQNVLGFEQSTLFDDEVSKLLDKISKVDHSKK